MGYKKYNLCKGYKMDKEVEEVLGIQQGGRREVGKGVQVVITACTLHLKYEGVKLQEVVYPFILSPIACTSCTPYSACTSCTPYPLIVPCTYLTRSTGSTCQVTQVM